VHAPEQDWRGERFHFARGPRPAAIRQAEREQILFPFLIGKTLDLVPGVGELLSSFDEGVGFGGRIQEVDNDSGRDNGAGAQKKAFPFLSLAGMERPRSPHAGSRSLLP